MNNTPTPETDAAYRYWPSENAELVDADFARRLERERDEAREELSSIHRWVERHNQDGFDDKLTHRQNIDICYDLLYDRLNMAELKLNRIKRAVIATLDENRHLADGMNCTLIKLKTVVPTWE